MKNDNVKQAMNAMYGRNDYLDENIYVSKYDDILVLNMKDENNNDVLTIDSTIEFTKYYEDSVNLNNGPISQIRIAYLDVEDENFKMVPLRLEKDMSFQRYNDLFNATVNLCRNIMSRFIESDIDTIMKGIDHIIKPHDVSDEVFDKWRNTANDIYGLIQSDCFVNDVQDCDIIKEIDAVDAITMIYDNDKRSVDRILYRIIKEMLIKPDYDLERIRDFTRVFLIGEYLYLLHKAD